MWAFRKLARTRIPDERNLTELAISGAGEMAALSNLPNSPSGRVSWLDIPYKYYINKGLVWERRVILLLPRTRYVPHKSTVEKSPYRNIFNI